MQFDDFMEKAVSTIVMGGLSYLSGGAFNVAWKAIQAGQTESRAKVLARWPDWATAQFAKYYVNLPIQPVMVGDDYATYPPPDPIPTFNAWYAVNKNKLAAQAQTLKYYQSLLRKNHG